MDTKHPLRTLRPSAAASAKSGRVGSWGHRAHWQRPVLLVWSVQTYREWRIPRTWKSMGKMIWYTNTPLDFGMPSFWKHLNGSWVWVKWLQHVKAQKPRKHPLVIVFFIVNPWIHRCWSASLNWLLAPLLALHFGFSRSRWKTSGCRVCYQVGKSEANWCLGRATFTARLWCSAYHVNTLPAAWEQDWNDWMCIPLANWKVNTCRNYLKTHE